VGQTFHKPIGVLTVMDQKIESTELVFEV
jgi:hypothetical protein